MKPCPYCGALLTTALAEAVANPERDESCPQADRLTQGLRRVIERAKAAALGSIAQVAK